MKLWVFLIYVLWKKINKYTAKTKEENTARQKQSRRNDRGRSDDA